MNCVSPQDRKGSNASKERQATKATLAQIMALNSRRTSNRSNASRLGKREFAQTMVIPSRTSSRTNTANEQPSNRLAGKRHTQ